MKTCICKKCGVSFVTGSSRRGTFCSRECCWDAKRRHGVSFSSEHVAWRDMKSRCLNPDHKDYPKYGARGIKVCDRWMSFDNFYADMGIKPAKGLSIDRIDNNGNYEPT